MSLFSQLFGYDTGKGNLQHPRQTLETPEKLNVTNQTNPGLEIVMTSSHMDRVYSNKKPTAPAARMTF